MTTVSTGLEGAREAVGRYAWSEAFAIFAAADAAAPLAPDHLDAMAECAWWLGKMRHCIALRERAHTAYLKDDNPRAAARVATSLADHHADLGETAEAEGWLQRATRLLEGRPEGAEHGWLSLVHGLMHRNHGDLKAAGPFAATAKEIGARHQDKDLFALGLAFHGLSIAFTEDPDVGLPMVEEATQGAVAGELGARATGWIYCMMIATNAQVADWQTAGHWSEAATNWCNRQAINGFPGVCRIHRAEIMRLRGAFADAEEEARVAAAELASFNLMFTGFAFAELGEVRVRMGDLDAAEEAFRQAGELGLTPQPGLALALMQRGKTRGAATSLRRALADTSLGPLDRARLLPAQVEVALELDDLEVARTAAAELAEIADANPRPAVRATAEAAAAAVGLADGALDDAERAAIRARALFDEVDLVHESARALALLGRIHQARGESERARSELSESLAALEGLGALPDARSVREALDSVPAS